MLIGLDARLTPDLLDCLMRMGHGDEIAVVDANFPAASVAVDSYLGKPVVMAGLDAPEVIGLIAALMPLDGFADHCALRMEIDDAPEALGPVHEEAFDIVSRAMPEGAHLGAIPRRDFYPRARQAFAVVATSEARPYGCFILRKGVIL